jgi:hypothetical protein
LIAFGDTSRMIKDFVAVGEEKLGQWTEQVLGNEALMRKLGGALQTALAMRVQAQKTFKAALAAVGVPTLDDVKRVEAKLGEVEALFGDINAQLDRLQQEHKQ